MQEIRYWLANDGKRFDNQYDCIDYERQKDLEEHKNEFQFYNHHKQPIPIEEATTEDITFIVVKSDNCVEAIGKWFCNDNCKDPFEGVYSECVGTWVYGEEIDSGYEWLKLELEIERLQNIVNEINKE